MGSYSYRIICIRNLVLYLRLYSTSIVIIVVVLFKIVIILCNVIENLLYRRCIASLKMNGAEEEIDIIDSLAVEYAFTIFLVALQYKCQCLASIVRKKSTRKTSALTTANSLIVWKICVMSSIVERLTFE